MDTIVILELANLTKAQKAALTVLGIDYKNVDITKDCVVDVKVLCRGKHAVSKKPRTIIRCPSTDALIAYNINLIRVGRNPCDIEKACDKAREIKKRPDVLLYEREKEQMTQKEWMRRNVRIILSASNKDILKACNNRRILAKSYTKVKASLA